MVLVSSLSPRILHKRLRIANHLSFSFTDQRLNYPEAGRLRSSQLRGLREAAAALPSPLSPFPTICSPPALEDSHASLAVRHPDHVWNFVQHSVHFVEIARWWIATEGLAKRGRSTTLNSARPDTRAVWEFAGIQPPFFRYRMYPNKQRRLA